MKWTGERLVTQVNEYYTYEHLHRYFFAMDFVEAKAVLDVASGEGYGTFLMAAKAESVVGIDIDPAATEHAGNKYRQENVSFDTADICQLPFGPDTFDVITCFETIEHLTAHEAALDSLKRVLKPGGILLISTPDSESTHHLASRGRNPYHPKELNLAELTELLEKRFKHLSILYQKTINASVMVNAKSEKSNLTEYRGDFKGFTSHNPVDQAQYFVAVCSDEQIGVQLNNSLVTYNSTKKSLIEKIVFRVKNSFRQT
ncbi:MAG: class I SAM-dependent methyltransferase [Roseivirga sp.]|nr:class I SAM-dependent methyltransferase [Roseivirga sp.]